MINLSAFSVRELQKECAKAMGGFNGTNDNLSKFNKLANHNSQQWYKVVIEEYIKIYGGLPSTVGPGKDIKLILD